MKLDTLFANGSLKDERAVSPVVGVALLIAITVILAAVIGAVVLGLGTGGVDTPQAQMQADFDAVDDAGNSSVAISHQSGEPLPVDELVFIDENGTEYDASSGDLEWSDGSDVTKDEEVTAGQTVVVQADADELSVIWEDPNSDSENILEEFSA